MEKVKSEKEFIYSCRLKLDPDCEKVLDSLVDLGYIDCYRNCITTDELKTEIWTVGNKGICGLTGFEEENSKVIICGNNTNLFLSIAAINNKDDYKQWFTNGNDWYLHEERSKFIESDLWHKATISELFSLFGLEEDELI